MNIFVYIEVARVLDEAGDALNAVLGHVTLNTLLHFNFSVFVTHVSYSGMI